MRLLLNKIEPVDVLVLDVTLAFVIRNFLPRVRSATLATRGEWVHVHPLFLLRWLVETFRSRRPRQSYWVAVLAVRRPKVVVTMADNDPWLLNLSNVRPNTKWIVLQNAIRFPTPEPRSVLGSNRTFSVEYWSFGEWEQEHFETLGVQFSPAVPSGSLRNSQWIEIRKDRPLSIDFDVCLVSQFRTRLIDHYIMIEFEECVRNLHQWMIRNPEKRVVVAGMGTPKVDAVAEQVFIADLLPGAELIQGRDSDPWQTFELCDRASVTVSSNSTAGLESLARGNRALLTGRVFSTAAVDFSSFSQSAGSVGDLNFCKALDKMIDVDRKKFWSVAPQDNIRRLMADAPHATTGPRLRQRVEEILMAARQSR